jgi:uncharacterized protein YkwD
MAGKTATSVLLALSSITALLLGGAAPATAMSCQNTDTPAVETTLDDFDASVFCLINAQRGASGRSALRPNWTLHQAAFGYATSMEEGGFFSHYGDFFGHPSGATPVSRLRQVGYIRRRNVWMVGENLHWATAEESTPADVVRAWMSSPIHRKYLLKARFEDLGVAAIRGIPADPTQSEGITIASEYGFRR